MTYLSSSSECPQCGANHKGKPFCVYEDGYHCFSCGYHKRGDRGFSVREQRIAIPNLPDVMFNPEQFSLTNLHHLSQWFITKEDLREHSIGETKDGGIVFPNIVEGEVVCYQQRWYNPRAIKSGGPKIPLVSSIDSPRLVLVEDPVSYIRLSGKCDVACLWGTKANYNYLQQWVKKYDEILVWLDNDKEKEINSGQIAANKILQMLNSVLKYEIGRYGFGGHTDKVLRNIVTDKDPKWYGPSEIDQILGEHNGNLDRQPHTFEQTR